MLLKTQSFVEEIFAWGLLSYYEFILCFKLTLAKENEMMGLAVVVIRGTSRFAVIFEELYNNRCSVEIC